MKKINVEGFRSLRCIKIDFDPLTVLIGENDAGKSSVLDIIDILLNGKPPDQDDFYTSTQGESSDRIEITAEFQLEENDSSSNQFSIDGILSIRKVLTTNGEIENTFLGEKFLDERLNINFSNLQAADQKSLIKQLQNEVDDNEISNKDKRNEWFLKYCAAQPKIQNWNLIPTRWPVVLPRFERYSAMDYKTPGSMVAKTLKQVFEQTIFEPVNVDGVEKRRLIKELRDVEILAKRQLEIKVAELEEHIKRYNRKIIDFGYQPEFDFLNSLKSGEFTVDTGRGLHSLTKVGDGSKRRMFLAVMDWDREVTLRQTREEANLPSIIRGYDEPDTNLHYEAQRLMYQTISEIVGAESSRVQALLCTHSLAMIDRAPAQSIRRFSLDDDGCTEVEKLLTQNDNEIEEFLLNLAKDLGITNSVIFYEHCFILIEGETEENALPVLYKKIYNRSLVEDGIRIINVRGNGAVKEFLRLLHLNRQRYTLVLVDTDTQNNKSAKLHPDILKEAQFGQEFIDNHVIYIGQVEFEDVFSDEIIVKALTAGWPKVDGEWIVEDIRAVRSGGKFSDAIRKLVHESNVQENTMNWSKPEFGKVLANECPVDQLPGSIIEFFKIVRAVAGIE